MSAAVRGLLSWLFFVSLVPVPSPAQTRTVAVLGDSLSTGYGISAAAAWPGVVERHAARSGVPLDVRRFVRNGATMRYGREVVGDALSVEPDVLVVALGGNDLLQRRPVEGVAADLRFILDAALRAGVPVLLCGWSAPPEWPVAERIAFENVWRLPAASRRLWLVDFLLAGVARVPAMNLPDGIHPNASGSRLVAANVWAGLRPLLASLP